jgi:hypothetical protein
MNNCDFDTQLFIKRAVRTVAWCLHRLELSGDTAALWSILPPQYAPLHRLSDEARQPVLAPIFETQARFYDSLAQKPDSEYLDDFRRGRIVVFFPDVTLSDGVAQIESSGFFDYDNYPPFDTWLYYVNRTDGLIAQVLAWVPPPFIKHTDNAIQMCAEECIVFLTDWQEPCYIDVLRQANMLV